MENGKDQAKNQILMWYRYIMSASISDSNGCVPIFPFGGDNPLDERVQSDHGEVAVVTPNGRVICAWNISNPVYHKYFATHSGKTFTDSHLVQKDGSKWLDQKIDNQIETIANSLKSGSVAVQVVAEGYRTFYDKLAESLGSGEQFAFVSLLNEKGDELSSIKNVTGIVVDTSKYYVLDQGVIKSTYDDRENERTSELYRSSLKIMLDSNQLVV